MPVLAWIGIIVSFLVAVPVLYFLGRSVAAIFLAKRELERPHPGAGVVEIAGPKRVKKPSGVGARAKAGSEEEDRAMEEALKKLETRARERKGSASGRGSRSRETE